MWMNKARPTILGSLIKHRAYLNLQKYNFFKNANRKWILLKFVLEIKDGDTGDIDYKGEG